jgi:UDP-glucose 4-epimerase
MVIPTFVQQALAEQEIRVYGDGSQRRCFTHVSDVVDALIGIAEHPLAVGEVYNIGSNQEVTILDLARRIRMLANSHSPIRFVPYGEAYEEGFEDMMRRVPDTTKVRALIGYDPLVDLDGILTSVIDYYRARMVQELGTPARSLAFYA